MYTLRLTASQCLTTKYQQTFFETISNEVIVVPTRSIKCGHKNLFLLSIVSNRKIVFISSLSGDRIGSGPSIFTHRQNNFKIKKTPQKNFKKISKKQSRLTGTNKHLWICELPANNGSGSKSDQFHDIFSFRSTSRLISLSSHFPAYIWPTPTTEAVSNIATVSISLIARTNIPRKKEEERKIKINCDCRWIFCGSFRRAIA